MGRLTLTQRIRGLRRLSHTARRDVLRAQVALLRAQLTVRFGRRGALLSAVHPTHVEAAPGAPGALRANPPSERISDPPTAEETARARELAVAVRRVADHGLFRAHCLARALATCWLLGREGMANAVIRVGVAIRDRRLIAHAWVEYAGTPLVESTAEVQDLSEVEGLRVRPVA